MLKKIQSKGFTLAEVLITLTIIGIISAITLPALQNNVNTTAMEKQTSKFYSQLQEMVDRYKSINGIDQIDSDIRSEANLKKYFKIKSKCATKTDCFASKYYSVRDLSKTYSLDDMSKTGNVSASDPDAATYLLADGTTFGINGHNIVFFDINGPKKPNKVGYDMWVAQISDDGNIDGYGCNDSTTKATIATDLENCLKGENGKYTGCFGHFVRNGFKIDY